MQIKQRILEGEPQRWQEIFLLDWEDFKQEDPEITFEESVELSRQIRAWLYNFFDKKINKKTL